MSQSTGTGRPLVADSMLALVGATPMVRLRRVVPDGAAEVLLKLESYNPGGSVKDRIGLAMVEAAERDGVLRPGDTIVEPTSGNTGIALALVAAVKGYHLIITMPDDSSPERKALLEHYGAQVVLTPARKLMKGAIDRARAIVDANPGSFMPQQFANPANPEIHSRTTAHEILEATEGRLDAFVAGVGTGGTITGVGRVLKETLDAVHVVAVEPARSRALSGGQTRPHALQGIGAGFVPAVLDREVIDEVMLCEDHVAFEMTRRLAREEGLSAGMSAGAAVWGGAADRATARSRAPRRLGGPRQLSVERPDPALAALDFTI